MFGADKNAKLFIAPSSTHSHQHRDEGAALRPRYAAMNHVLTEGQKGEEAAETHFLLPHAYFDALTKFYICSN